MHGRKRKDRYEVEREKSKEEDSLKEENKKLKDKISAMRHHLCLLEFGLGSIATLILEQGNNRRKDLENPACSSTTKLVGKVLPKAKDNVNELELESVGNTTTACGYDCDKTSCENYRKTVLGIGGVLQDVETALKIYSEEDDRDKSLAGVSGSQNWSAPDQKFRGDHGSHDIDDTVLVDHDLIGDKPTNKDRIYIDEKQPGGDNVLTGVCNIQVVENTGLYEMQMLGRSTEKRGTNNPIDCIDLTTEITGLEALSTLARVAAVASSSSVKSQEGESSCNEAGQQRAMSHLDPQHQHRSKRTAKQLRK